jgi:hypothetical protein
MKFNRARLCLREPPASLAAPLLNLGECPNVGQSLYPGNAAKPSSSNRLPHGSAVADCAASGGESCLQRRE